MSTETLQQRRMSGVGVLGREILAGLVPVLVVLVLWEIGYLLVPHNTYLHGPIEVLSLLSDPAHFVPVLAALGDTFLMLVLGYVISVVFSLVLASVVVVSRIAERAIMPIAIIVGVVPVIVITPVLLMLVGRGPATSVVVCVIITFFPALINIVSGMRSPSRSLIDLTSVLGGNPAKTLLLVRLPSSIPGIFSAAKLALPAALTGVILTEYIATGRGVGTFINLSRANFQYPDMWAGIFATLVLSVLAYSVLGTAELLLRDRYVSGASRSRRAS
ncbi:ABC transporter permease [Leifsonia sp. NCR5]|uniref:ABC transporter permease n=1 Tax=Leifsonia sp. NCR5 TaxID=1978342 RepID=UPI000A19A367|nr:ABC transporter permease subunit [Leifsonia sp. NCR5]